MSISFHQHDLSREYPPPISFPQSWRPVVDKQKTIDLGHGSRPCAAGQFVSGRKQIEIWMGSIFEILLIAQCIDLWPVNRLHLILHTFFLFVINGQIYSRHAHLMHKTVEGGLAILPTTTHPLKQTCISNKWKEGSFIWNTPFFLFAPNTTSFIHNSFDVSKIVRYEISREKSSKMTSWIFI